MGRGLGEVQRAVLQIAYRNRVAVGGSIDEIGALPDVTNNEVLCDHFGWPRPPGEPPTGRILRRWCYAADRVPTYAADKASLCRALKQLRRRGLIMPVKGIHRDRLGINLTRRGFEVAAALEAVAQSRNAVSA